MFLQNTGNHLQDYTLSPNTAAEFLALMLHIQWVSDSNLGPETGYPDVFQGFH
jgi:hypothetical protein